MDSELYEQLNIKSEKNQLIEKSDLSIKKLLQTSSAIIVDQTQTESFSLRLSESYVDETQKSLVSKFEQNQGNEIIVISDSSSNESIFSDKPSKLIYTKGNKVQKSNILESSEDEMCLLQETVFTTIQNINSTSKKVNGKNNKKRVIIKESDSEIEQYKVPQLIKEAEAESEISENKEKEIIQWLLTNFDNSKCSSSCSQESIISDSRKSDTSSGNSSLERFELNFETPNNRGKLSKSNNIIKCNKIIQKESLKQTTIDQYFIKSKKAEPNFLKNLDKMYRSTNYITIPMNTKVNSKKFLMAELESKNFKISEIKNCNKTKINNLKVNSKKIVTPKMKPFNCQTVINTPDKSLLNNIKANLNVQLLSESDSYNSKISINKNCTKSPINNIEQNSKRIIIPELEFLDYKTSRNKNSKRLLNNIKINSIPMVMTESESFNSETSENSNFINPSLNNMKIGKKKIITESNYLKFNDHIHALNTNNLCKKKSLTNTSLLPISSIFNLKFNDTVDSLNNSDLVLKNKTNNKKITSINDTTINDCADILENLYGKTWRNKASTLISNTKPKKQQNFFKDVQKEKNITFKQRRYNWLSDSDLSDKENFYKNSLKLNETFNKSKKINDLKNNFINDDSTIESSLDYSYYTAFSNPKSSENNKLKIISSSTVNVYDKNEKKEVLYIYDSESDVDQKNWKNKTNYRKQSFSSSSPVTSEFDPEDIVPPKITTKNFKINKFNKFGYIIQKNNEQIEHDTNRSFLASLSKNVPLENINFKAMVYRVKYNVMKEELCKVLFKLFNEQVFNNQLPNDMLIEWSTRLRGTAGKCYNKQSLKVFNNTVRSSRIVLATKILDSPDRLRDTLIHEMCHAATWLINNISDGHGSFWKAWANKARKVFPELPPISRCHNYEIKTKYTYKCTTCGYNIGRHSKSLDLNKKRCGYCHGKFQLFINKVTKTGNIQKKSTIQTKEPSGFAVYVKENYQLVKQSGIAVKHHEIMKILGQQFSVIKITQKPNDYIKNNESKLS